MLISLRARCLDVSAPSRVVLYTFLAWRSCPVGFSGVFSSDGETSWSSIDRGFHHMFCRVVGIFACMYSKKKTKKSHSLSLSLSPRCGSERSHRRPALGPERSQTTRLYAKGNLEISESPLGLETSVFSCHLDCF